MTDNALHEVDAAVVGLGSGGSHVAKGLAQAGWNVVGFEPGRVGGECPFVACVPSKSLLHDAFRGSSWSDAVARRDALAHDRDDEAHAEELADAGVTIVRQPAQIVGPNLVESPRHRVAARHVVIATGAAPTRPGIEGIGRQTVWTSADALSSSELPHRLVIVGGGPVGAELSEVYARFGSEVTLCEHDDVLTNEVEPEVSAMLREHLVRLGVVVHLGVEVSAIEAADRCDLVRIAGGAAYPADRILLAAGVTPRLASIGLTNIGLDSVDIVIDKDCAVEGFDWLWAVGDVTPHSNWTHGATIQARALVDRLTRRAWVHPATILPRCTFTNPPLGAVGETAAAARKRGIDVVVGLADFDKTVRSSIEEIQTGLAAIVVDRTAGRILGASVFGPRADDLVQIITAFMVAGVDIHTAHRTAFPFPTHSQVLEAAIDDAVTNRNDTT